MRIFGWFVAIVMLLGVFHIIDVQVCVAGHGKCPPLKEKKCPKA